MAELLNKLRGTYDFFCETWCAGGKLPEKDSPADLCREAAKEIEQLQREVQQQHRELCKFYATTNAQHVNCMKCGNVWHVPKEQFGNPVWDCPRCDDKKGGG